MPRTLPGTDLLLFQSHTWQKMREIFTYRKLNFERVGNLNVDEPDKKSSNVSPLITGNMADLYSEQHTGKKLMINTYWTYVRKHV